MRCMEESERMIGRREHARWQRHPRQREIVRRRAGEFAERERKAVHQQHVLRAAWTQSNRSSALGAAIPQGPRTEES